MPKIEEGDEGEKKQSDKVVTRVALPRIEVPHTCKTCDG
jgi:hypothetical protein